MAVLDKWAIYEHPLVNWHPHSGQLVVAENDCRHKVVCAGRRWGKDFLSAIDKLLIEIFYTKPLANQLVLDGKCRRFWIVGPSYAESEKTFRVIWYLCKKLGIPMDKGSFNSPETGLMQIRLWDGAMEIVAKSAQVPERLVGEGLCGVIMCEAAKMKSTIWPRFIRPMLADFNGWSLHQSTPEGKNWFYDLWRFAQDPNNPDWSSWRMPAWMNIYVYTVTGRSIASGKLPADTVIPAHEVTSSSDVYKLLEAHRQTYESVFKLAKKMDLTIDREILDSLAELTSEAFLQEIGADFTEFVGRVFKEFDEEVHVTDLAYDPGWQTFACCDYGYSNPNVWLLLQMGRWGEINVLDEIYESGLDPEDFADEIRYRGLNPPGLRVFYPDPADPGASRILEKKLGIKASGGTGGELNNRLNWIRKGLRDPRVVTPGDRSGLEPGVKRPRLLFDRKCKNTIEDMLNYKYPELRKDGQRLGAGGGELPMKKDDHGPEALGRFFAGLFGTFGKPHTGVQVYQADFGGDNAPNGFDYTDPDRFEYTKSLAFRRPAAHENRREDFPKLNDSLANYLNGVYD